MPYKIAIVDDRSQNRISLSEKINYSGEVEVIMMTRNGSDFLEQLKTLPLSEHPQLTLMDIDMPVMDGIETVRHCHSLYEHIRHIMLTVFDDDDKLFDAIQAGADGYLLKEERVDRIVDSIKEVIEKQGAPMSPSIARKALNLLSGAKKADKNPQTVLSSREMDILKGVVRGLDYKKIAEELFISPLTVRKHIANIYGKLHVKSKVQVVNLAIKNRWV